MRFPIRHKLIIFLVVPLCATFGGMAWLGLGAFDRQVRDQAEREMFTRVAEHANMLEATLREAMQVARSAAQFLEVEPDLDVAGIYDLARRNVAGNALVYGSSVAFGPGAFAGRPRFAPYVFRDASGLIAIDIASQAYDYIEDGVDWWTVPRQTGREEWTEPYFDEGSGNAWMITFSVPFRQDGRFRGVVTIDMRLDDLDDLIAPAVRKDAAIVTSTGNVVVHWDRRVVGQPLARAAADLGHLDWSALADRLVAGDSGMIRAAGWGEDGPYWVFFTPVSASGWGLAERIPEARALAPIHRQSRFVGMVVVVTTLFGLTAAAILSGWLARPVTRLNAAARRLAKGHRDVVLERGASDEVGELTERFREMAQGLAQRESALLRERHELTERVKDLDCIFSLSRLLEGRRDTGEMLSAAVELLPPAWQHAEVAAARIVLDGVEHATAGFVETSWRQAAVLRVDGKDAGRVEVVYLEARPDEAEGPFLVEERALLDEVAARLEAAIGRRRAELELIRLNEDLEDRVERRTRALAEREAQFRAVVTNTPGVVFRFAADPETLSFEFLSDGIETLTGYPAADFLGDPPRRRLRQLMPPHDREQVLHEMREMLRSSRDAAAASYDMSFRIERADGDERWVYARASVVYGPDGRPTHVDGTLVDVTERHRQEEHIHEQRQRLDLALRGARLGLWDVDLRTGRGVVNDRWAEMLGYPPNEVGDRVQEVWLEHLHPDDRARVLGAGRAYRDGESQEYECEYRVTTRDGQLQWHRTSGSVVERDRAGLPVRMVGIVQDVTARNEAQLRIAEVAEQLQATLAHTSSGILMLDGSGQVKVFNEQYPKLMEYPPEMFHEGTTVAEIARFRAARGDFGPGEPEAIVRQRESLYRDGTFEAVEETLPSGRIVERHRARMADGGVVVVCDDVTARRHAEDVLRESERRLRALLEITPIGVAVVPRDDGRIAYVNPRLGELLGVGADDLVGADASRFYVNASDRERIYDMLERDGSVEDFELLLRRPDGSRFWALMSVLPTEHEGVPAAFTWIYDVTERKHAEEEVRAARDALEEQSALLQSVLSNIPQGVVATDAAERIVVWNDPYREGLGVPKELLEGGCSAFDAVLALARQGLYGDGDPVEHATRRMEVLRSGRQVRSELTVAGAKTYDAIARPRPDGGFLITYTDITERRRMMEELLGAKEAAEAATRAKANFLATVSHEIRTPMNGVLGMVDLLWHSRLDDDQRQMLRAVRDSGYALLAIINDVLDFSKIEAGRMELESVPMSLTDALESSAATVMPGAARRGIRVVTFVDPDLPDFVLGDPTRIRQILFNLAGNAVKFSERGDEVVLRALSGGAANGRAVVRLVVEDEGAGIPEEARGQLFEAFTQAENSTTRRFGGTGLGLSICQRLTEMMGATIEAASEHGAGSTFTVTVELSPAPAPAGRREACDLAGLRVLVASASAAQREAGRAYLAHQGAEVEACAGAGEVAARLGAAAPGGRGFDVVVIADHAVPGEAIAALPATGPGASGAGPHFVVAQDPSAPRFAGRASTGAVPVDACPLRRAALVEAVAVAAGRASPEIHHDDEPAVDAAPAPSVEEALERGALVLVVEDNPTNRDVIQRQLALLGYACEVAADGRAALSMWRARTYAAVLTDCHMPEMDGFELTATIRDEEAGAGRRTPIVAITANVLDGEAERCIAAGMDDYLSKPLEMTRLNAALGRWVDAAARDRPERPDGGQAPPDDAAAGGGTAPIDDASLRESLGDDPETIRDVLLEFVPPALESADEVRAAREVRSARAVRSAMHSLKSSARTVGAHALADLCEVLERAGRDEDWGTIDGRAGELDRLVRQVAEHVAQL